jgi:hypothetical protein
MSEGLPPPDEGILNLTLHGAGDVPKVGQLGEEVALANELCGLAEAHELYFDLQQPHRFIPIHLLVSSKTDEENAKGGANAPKLMAQASAGEISKRDPIAVEPMSDGKYLIRDGNGTYTAAKQMSWSSLPAHIMIDWTLFTGGELHALEELPSGVSLEEGALIAGTLNGLVHEEFLRYEERQPFNTEAELESIREFMLSTIKIMQYARKVTMLVRKTAMSDTKLIDVVQETGLDADPRIVIDVISPDLFILPRYLTES